MCSVAPCPLLPRPFKRKARIQDMYNQCCQTQSYEWRIKREAVSLESQDSLCPWTSPFAPASSGQTWSHPCSRRCSLGQRTTFVSSGLSTKGSRYCYITITQNFNWHDVSGNVRDIVYRLCPQCSILMRWLKTVNVHSALKKVCLNVINSNTNVKGQY